MPQQGQPALRVGRRGSEGDNGKHLLTRPRDVSSCKGGRLLASKVVYRDENRGTNNRGTMNRDVGRKRKMPHNATVVMPPRGLLWNESLECVREKIEDRDLLSKTEHARGGSSLLPSPATGFYSYGRSSGQAVAEVDVQRRAARLTTEGFGRRGNCGRRSSFGMRWRH